jgi:pimeloyl-ACP methyl ester carboxylesterase
MNPFTPVPRRGLYFKAAGSLIAASLTACAFADTAPSANASIPLLQPNVACSDLAGVTLSAAAIALPTGGARITAATLVAATPEVVGPTSVTHALPEHCQILGRIEPVDPAAPPILFQLNVPTRWNQKTIQVGGGGLNGSIPRNLAAVASSASPISAAFPPDAEYPLLDGYAMFGGDSGHQDPSTNAVWALNAEAWQNFGHAGLKKTHDAAFEVLRALYGRKPKVSYFMGQSQGGREAMEVAQRYPRDYDGVVATAPLIGYTAHVIHKTLLATVQTGAGWVPQGKFAAVSGEVLRQCDGLDGIADGVVSHYRACTALFDPRQVSHPWAAIRCPQGADTASTCVSDAQIATLNQMHAPTRFGFPLANGWTEFPGYGVGREALAGWLNINPQPNVATQPALGQPGATVSWGILKDPQFNLVNFAIDPFMAQIQAASALIDSTNPDLSEFFAHGGRLIVKTQSSDYSSNPQTVMRYHDLLVGRFGPRLVDRHVRLYVMPFGDHGGAGQSATTGEALPQFVDLVRMSMDWVERGITPPDAPVQTARLRVPPYTVTASKPMCRYPLYPRYIGGEPKQAGSYQCTAD